MIHKPILVLGQVSKHRRLDLAKAVPVPDFLRDEQLLLYLSFVFVQVGHEHWSREPFLKMDISHSKIVKIQLLALEYKMYYIPEFRNTF